MNKLKRKRLNEAKILIEKANDIINDVLDDEDESYNNLPDNLQQTERGEQMENNINELEDAINSLDEAINSLDNIE